MAKKALILDNKVVDVVDTEFDVHSDLTWMDCTDDCVAGMGWTVVSGVLTAPAAQPAVTYSTKRRQKYKALGSQDEMRYDDEEKNCGPPHSDITFCGSSDHHKSQN